MGYFSIEIWGNFRLKKTPLSSIDFLIDNISIIVVLYDYNCSMILLQCQNILFNSFFIFSSLNPVRYLTSLSKYYINKGCWIIVSIVYWNYNKLCQMWRLTPISFPAQAEITEMDSADQGTIERWNPYRGRFSVLDSSNLVQS